MAIPTGLKTDVLTFERSIHAPIAEVYRAWTARDGLTAWLSDGAYTNGTVGGYLTVYWYNQGHAFGEFKELEENTKIVFTWRASGEEQFSLVTVELDEQDGNTFVTVTHSDLAEESLDVYKQRWNDVLDNLKSTLENGSDTRITSRIIIGIIPGTVSDEDRESLSLEEGEGTLITQVLDGFSAKESGLAANDIITHVEGQKLTASNNIFAILNSLGKKVGDTVQVEVHREGETFTKGLQLRGYPIPEMPTTYVELAERIQDETEANKKTLDALFVGVSETEAAQPPAEGEWSANDVLAHLILNERYNQDWVGGFFQGTSPISYSANTPARIKGVTQSYGSNAALVTELKRSWDETAATIRNIPEEHLNRADILWRMSFVTSQSQWHTDGHFNQIRNAIEASRQ